MASGRALTRVLRQALEDPRSVAKGGDAFAAEHILRDPAATWRAPQEAALAQIVEVIRGGFDGCEGEDARLTRTMQEFALLGRDFVSTHVFFGSIDKQNNRFAEI